MSLDDVIKNKQKANKKPNNNNNTNKKGNNPNNNNNNNNNNNQQAKKGTPIKTKKIRRDSKGSATSPSLNRSQSTASIVKTAKTIGASKAKRNANLDNKRGIRANNTPTKTEVKAQVNKQITSGLKISFRPQDLPKTTDKAVSQQIRAVLARTSRPNSAASARTTSTNNSNKGGRSVIARRNAPVSQNRNPKVRGKTILKVQH
ncbi:hypothetical protein EON64_19510 [archaeon]|nr:MAG: hypothetical protein EON64_19510 [archaeon]